MNKWQVDVLITKHVNSIVKTVNHIHQVNVLTFVQSMIKVLFAYPLIKKVK